MAGFRSFRTLLLLLLLHLGGRCCFSPAASSTQPPPPPKRRKISPLSHSQSPVSSAPPKTHASLYLSVRSYLSHLFSFSRRSPRQQRRRHQPHPTEVPQRPVAPPPPALQQPLRQRRLGGSDNPNSHSGSPAKPAGITSVASDSAKRPSSFASRNDVFPCAACGEVFGKPYLLDLHQATRHAFSELPDGDSGKNIVQIIFQSGWKGRGNGGGRGDHYVRTAPIVHRILKIHNSPKTLARFEEYRESVRSRAAARWAAGSGGGGGDERCLADGNERLRFYCATFLCGLGREGNLGTCGSPFCAACGIVRHGFSGKDADGVATHGTGWGAHASLPEELEQEFQFMNVRRAMLVCRVVAGRVGLGNSDAIAAAPAGELQGEHHRMYDSVVAAAGRQGDDGGGGGAWTGEDVLSVFNPRAVLPCFVIVYGM